MFSSLQHMCIHAAANIMRYLFSVIFIFRIKLIQLIFFTICNILGKGRGRYLYVFSLYFDVVLLALMHKVH